MTTINASSEAHVVALIVPLLGSAGLDAYLAASPTVSAVLTTIVTILGYFGIHAAAGNVTSA